MIATNVQSLASVARDHFITTTRADGPDVVRLDLATAPEWVRDMVCLAHGGMFPDDYKYSFTLDALDAIACTDDDDEVLVEADTDPGDLVAWVASHADRALYCDDYMQSTGSRYGDLVSVLRCGQFTERASVLNIVRRALEAQLTAVAVAV